MTHGCDVVVRQTANGFVVEPKSGNASSERVAGSWMVFSTIEQLQGYLSTHFSRPDPKNFVADAARAVLPNVSREVRWAK